MIQRFNIYCDESGHLANDSVPVMVVGAVWCPAERTAEIATRLREIKGVHGQSPDFEIKWNKVSNGGERLYSALLDYFYDTDDLHFRAIVVRDNVLRRPEDSGQTPSDWYDEMFFTMLMPILEPDGRYRIYLDIKDTFSHQKVERLPAVIANAKLDFSRTLVERMQSVRSREVALIQLADLLIGAVAYANRGLTTNAAKLALVERMRLRSGLSLRRSTLVRESKTNLLLWTPQPVALT